METFQHLVTGFAVALSPMNLLFATIGCVLGTLIGVLPGLGPAAGTALLIPITFRLEPTSAIIMLAAIYYGAMYGGTITSVLINVPGEAASVVTCLDGYEMAKRGRAGAALGIAAVGSFIGGTVATFGLVLVALPLSRLALKFGPPEYFSLICVGLSLVMGLAGKSLTKALMMGILGLLFSLVGVDPVEGAPRFTFGIPPLMDGVRFVPVVMGFFGIGEILLNAEKSLAGVMAGEGKVSSFFPRREEWRICVTSILRGTGLGFFLGLIPGTNSAVASFMSYAIEKKVSDHPEQFGTGIIEGVAAPETANNAYANAALIPLFTLGLPGSPTIAILMGALIMNGLTPGPLLFQRHATFVWAVIASLYIGNVILLILNLPLVGWWAKLLKIPYNILVVFILVFCVVGGYSLNNSMFDVGVMILCGVLGYAFKKLDFPLAPAILTLILGPLMERSLRESLSLSLGDYRIFITRPISLTLLLITAVILATSAWQAWPAAVREESKEAQV
ncbi:MAG TPA: tripartite tricarboxylate transporter permease [Candidatus Methylomirabilis sp.]|nr:tripartite tricarboxylate transporter permease [Candidatus Methylomirabilis sp.]